MPFSSDAPKKHSALIVADLIRHWRLLNNLRGLKSEKSASWCSLLDILTLMQHPDPHNPTAGRICLNKYPYNILAKTVVCCLSISAVSSVTAAGVDGRHRSGLKEEGEKSLYHLPSLSCMFALAPRPRRKAHSSTLLIWAAKIKGVDPSWCKNI